MYKVVLVDDEEYGREAIRRSLGRISLRLEVTGEAKDGLSGLELILREKPVIPTISDTPA